MSPPFGDDAAPPLFEVLHEDADPSAGTWLKLQRLVTPFWNLVTEVFGDGYAAGARRVLEQKERVEDRFAARRRGVAEHE